MTDFADSTPAADAGAPAPSAAHSAADAGPVPYTIEGNSLLPFSRLAVWGFVVACVGLLTLSLLGLVGMVGAFMCSFAWRKMKDGNGRRGRGLAIAGMAVGLAALVITQVVRTIALA
jgi:hypothetical protein